MSYVEQTGDYSAEFARSPRAGLCDFSYAGPPARSLAFALGVA